MISEIDIRDWEKLDVERVKNIVLTTQHNYLEQGKETPFTYAEEAVLRHFFQSVELMKRKQIKPLPRLFEAAQNWLRGD